MVDKLSIDFFILLCFCISFWNLDWIERFPPDPILVRLYRSNVKLSFLFASYGQAPFNYTKSGTGFSPYSRTFLVFEKTPLSPQILKCNHSGGSAVLRDLTSESTLHDLQLSVQNSTQIDMASQKCNYTLIFFFLFFTYIWNFNYGLLDLYINRLNKLQWALNY